MPGDQIKKIDPAAEILELIKTQPELFTPNNRKDLRDAVLRLSSMATMLTASSFDESIFVTIANSRDLGETELGCLDTIWHLSEAEFFRRVRKADGEEEADAEEEEVEEEPAPEEGEGSEEGENADKIRGKLQEYTFKPEIQSAYLKLQQNVPVVLILPTNVMDGII